MPDSQLVSLDAATGKETLESPIANPKLDYTSTAAPIIRRQSRIGRYRRRSFGYPLPRIPRSEPARCNGSGLTTPRNGEPGIETWPTNMLPRTVPAKPGFPELTIRTSISITSAPAIHPVMAEKSRRATISTPARSSLSTPIPENCWHYQVSLTTSTIGRHGNHCLVDGEVGWQTA